MSAGPGRIYEIADQHRAALLAREREAASEMVRAYGRIWQRIQTSLDSLLTARAQAELAGEAIDAGWLFRYNRLATLQDQVEAELRAFAQFAESGIVQQQQAAVQAALLHAEQLTRAMADQAAFSVQWFRLPTDEVAQLVGFTRAGSPLRDLLARLAPLASEAIRDSLIQGLALGLNPTEIAREIRKLLGGNLARALRISRTETLRAYREATRRAYQANAEVVEGWIWNCACTTRSCAMCWAMHGTWHSLDEQLDDHPNGRCSMLPAVKPVRGMGAQWQPENGVDQFARLKPDQQDLVLGKAAGKAYRDGQFTLPDVVGRSWSADWGSMRRVRSLQEILAARSET